MRDGVWPLVGAATMRALDRHTIETLGVPGELLMESAGRAVAAAALAERARAGAGDVLVVCGTGNNGGDGLVAARHLALLGVPVRVALVGSARRLSADAARNRERARRIGLRIAEGPVRTAGAAVVVDALFGTGLGRPVEGAAAAAIRRIARARAEQGARVVAVDVPSGLDADTGRVLGVAAPADVTVTIALPKLGLALEPGRSLAGRVVVARIGIADEAPRVRPDAHLWSAAAAAARLPARPRDGHKGRFGHVLVAAGSPGKTGAAALAALGAGRVGAGLVTVACPAGVNPVLEVKCTEAMTAPVAEDEAGGLARSALEALLALAGERDVLALGPGVGRSAETVALVRALARAAPVPLVLDADGLSPFGEASARSRGAGLAALKPRRAATILTPHPGEAGRLLGVSAAEVNRDRVGSARRLAERSGAVVLLKGAASVVAAPDGRVIVNPTGGPALGSGGTGDVLTGVVAGFVAQGVEAFEAAALAAWVHGAAGDRVAAARGDAGVLASDVADALPATLAALRRGAPAAGAGGAEPLPGADGLALPFP